MTQKRKTPIKTTQHHRSKRKKKTLEEALPAYLDEHFTFGWDKRSRQLYLVTTTGNRIAYAITDTTLHHLIACAMDDQGVLVEPKDIETWLKQGAFSRSRNAEKIEVTQRVKGSPHQGKITLDIGDEKRTFITLSAKDEVVMHTECHDPHTVMLHVADQHPLPLPTASDIDVGEAIEKLLKVLPISGWQAYLFIGWLTFNLTHELDVRIPRVFLVLLGGQGSGKTSLCQHVIQRFLDPYRHGVQSLVPNTEDLVVSSRQTYVPIYDNMSRISPALSDNLCQMATGGAIIRRKRYSDHDSAISQLQRTLVFNSIEQPFTKSDLISRCLFLSFPPLAPEARRSETDLVDDLERNEAEIMQGLLMLCVDILKEWPQATPVHPGRAIDFSRWLAAFDRVLEKAPEDADTHASDSMPDNVDEALDGDAMYSVTSLEDAYQVSLQQCYLASLGDHPLAYLIYRIVETTAGDVWEGTPQELFNLIQREIRSGYTQLHPRQLPDNAIALGRQLDKYSALLKQVGVHVERYRQRQRMIRLWIDMECASLNDL
jgi:hypothetical protein